MISVTGAALTDAAWGVALSTQLYRSNQALGPNQSGATLASPVVPGAASLLTLRVLTCSNVVTEATTTTTASATANKISAVGWLSKKPMARTRHANTEWLVDCDSDDWISLFVVRPAVAAL